MKTQPPWRRLPGNQTSSHIDRPLRRSVALFSK